MKIIFFILILSSMSYSQITSREYKLIEIDSLNLERYILLIFLEPKENKEYNVISLKINELELCEIYELEKVRKDHIYRLNLFQLPENFPIDLVSKIRGHKSSLITNDTIIIMDGIVKVDLFFCMEIIDKFIKKD